MAKSSTITTGVDNLVNLVSEKKKISIAEASKTLAVDKELIEEWTDFLEEKGIIKLEYKFTTPYIVYKEPDNKTVAKNKKAFNTKKDTVVRQIDSTLKLIENHAAGLTDVKDEFDKINAELEDRIKSIRGELSELEKFDSLKKDLGKELTVEYESFKKKMQIIESRIKTVSNKYEAMMGNLSQEEGELDSHTQKLEEMKSAENKIKTRIKSLHDELKSLQNEEGQEVSKIDDKEKKISLMRLNAKRLQAELANHKKNIKPLIKEFQEAHNNAEKARDSVLKGLDDHLKKVEVKESKVQNIKNKFETYLKKKIDIDIMMDRLTSEIERLSGELKMLKQESKLLSLTTSDDRSEKLMKEIDKKFKSALEEKKDFEKKAEELRKIILSGEQSAKTSSDSSSGKPSKKKGKKK